MAQMLKIELRSNKGSATRARDRGSAMVMAAIVSTVVFALAGVLLSFANHQSSASRTDGQRERAIDGAMAGLAVANLALTTNKGYVGSSTPVTFVSGATEYVVTVSTDLAVAGGNRKIITSTGYSPSKASLSKSVRTLRQEVDLDPVAGGGFTYGVFTKGNYTEGATSKVIGGMYLQGGVTFGDGHYSTGDLTTPSNVDIGTNGTFTGTIRSDGSVTLKAGVTVNGSVYGGNINPGTGATIHGAAQSSGTLACTPALLASPCTQWSAPPRVTQPNMPSFTYPVSNAPGMTTLNGPAFVALIRNSVVAPNTGIQGIFNVNSDQANFNATDSLKLTGDLTIYASGGLTLPGTVVNNSGGKNVQLTVIDTGAFHLSAAALAIPPTVKTLIYITAGFETTYTVTLTGVLYVQAKIAVGPNSVITFAPVVEPPGFVFAADDSAPTTFTIRNVSTRETSGS